MVLDLFINAENRDRLSLIYQIDASYGGSGRGGCRNVSDLGKVASRQVLEPRSWVERRTRDQEDAKYNDDEAARLAWGGTRYSESSG